MQNGHYGIRIVGKYLFDPEMTADKMIFLTGPRQVGKIFQ